MAFVTRKRQIMKQETEMRKMESNKQVLAQVLERNEKALMDLKSTQEENLDLKRELLRHIMNRQAENKKLAASKEALHAALKNQEEALLELKKSREENLSLKKELVEHLHHHKTKMEQLQSHKEALGEIVQQHSKHVKELEELKKENLELKEELVQTMVVQKADKKKLDKYEEWILIIREELAALERDRATLKLVRAENHRLGALVHDQHKNWVQARLELNQRIHKSMTAKLNGLIAVAQVTVLGFAISCWEPRS
jgi:chromosome segregation ATPase